MLQMKEKDYCYKTAECTNNIGARRKFLKGLAYGTVAASMPGFTGIAKASTNWLQRPRELAFYNLHTEEKLSLTYFEGGQYITDAVKELNYLLRDHRSDDVYSMDLELYDLLYDLQSMLGGNKTLQVISGYRSPSTNAMLKRQSSGVAKKSLHMLGQAIDIRIEGVDSRVVQKASIAMKRGGVGYYRQSDFVHVDTGGVRKW